MADDNNSRYRQSDPFGRNPGPSGAAGQASDPLAELARLIGRNDPFSDLRDSRAAAPQHPAPQQDYPGYASDQAPQYGSDPAPHYGNDPTPRYGSDPAPRFGGDYPPRYDEQQQQQQQQQTRLDWPGTPAPSPSYSPAASPSYSTDPFALPSQQSRMPGAGGYDNQGYADPHSHQAADSYHSDHASHDAPAFSPAGDRPSFLQQPPLYPREPEAGAMPPPHDDEFYDDAPRGGRRKGLLTVVAVLCLAVIGTGVALGYRSFFGGTTSSSPPPVIRASNEPSKVQPPTQPVDQSASKFSYDRFGDRSQNEQVVVREEKPVDSREIGRSSVPRTVLPGAPNVPSQTQASSQAANPPSALGEPRRVRTVPIRPDGADTAAVPRSSPPAPAAPMQVAPPPTRQSNTVAEAPANPPPEAAPRPAPPRNTRTAVRTTQPQQQMPADSNAPLSLSPDNQLPPPGAAREAPPPPAPRAAAPSRVAAAPAGNGGGYLVQVSSQKSEADAQSSYRSIQSKYSSVLGGQRHTIRRADLGSRGIYYRAMVGPFGSRDEAIQLCSSLKAAGGDCVVQSN